MGRKIGIDLGTTNSVVAIKDGVAARVLDNKQDKSDTKSIVGLTNPFGGGSGEIKVGNIAYDNWEMAPNNTINSIKRLMGRGVSDKEVGKVKDWAYYDVVKPSDGTEHSIRVVIDGKEYSPVDISAMILRKLKEDAEDRLGEEVTHAVITVPAYFSQKQKAATRDAAQKAGLRVIKILEEPSAAAIAYGIDKEDTGDAKTILVYDLGGGTFDISIMMWSGQAFACLNKDGDMWLGGDDFDQLIVDKVVDYVQKEHKIDPRKDPRFMVALKKKARDAKEQLSEANSAPIILPALLRDGSGSAVDVAFGITRDEFEKMIRPLVAKSVVLAIKALRGASIMPDNVDFGELEEVFDHLADPNVRPNSKDASPKEWDKVFEWLEKGEGPSVTRNLDFVLLAGNATRIPMVRTVVEKLFGKDKVKRDIHPKNCVAMGAALVANMVDGWFCVECDEYNDPETTICKNPKCKAELVLDAGIEMPIVDPIIAPGVASFHYGIQTVGDEFAIDEFAIFVRKNDPCPTVDKQWHDFYTQFPNQRILSIPVYGGENEEKASANEFQGIAFALLPPGLPQETLIRIVVWLDKDEVFDLDVSLGDGIPVPFKLLTGGADEKAVKALELMEEKYKEAAGKLSAQDLVRVETERDEIFDLWQQGDYHEVTQRAEGLVFLPDLPSEKQLRNALSWDEDWVRRYGWAMDPNKVYALNNAIEAAKSALESRDPARVKNALEKLNAEDRDLGTKLAQALTWADFKIGTVVRTHNPVLAAKLRQELTEVEEALQKNNPNAMASFNNLLDRLQEEIDRIEKTKDAEVKCPQCGTDKSGNVCKNCGYDFTIPKRRSG